MSWEIDYLMRVTHYQDLIEQAEKERLIASFKESNQPAPHRQLAGWMGAQLVKWGAELQQYADSSAAGVQATAKQ
jgi:hypothetical protein